MSARVEEGATAAAAVDADEAAIDLNHLTVRFESKGQTVTALEDMTIKVARGEFLAMLGPSGCGKSTTLRIISGLVEPSAGTVTVLGGTPQSARAARRAGFVFQTPALMAWQTVLENVQLSTTVGPRELRRKVQMAPDEALELVGLGDFHHAYPSQLSGGMRQRVSIARALVSAPDILLMDEPFAALDEITREKLNSELLRIWQRTGLSVVFVTHSIAEAAFLAERIVVLSPRPGRVRAVVDNPLPQPRTKAVRESAAMHDLTSQLRAYLEEG